MASVLPTNFSLPGLLGQSQRNFNETTSSAPQIALPVVQGASQMNVTTTKPGQQLLPNYAMKLLKNAKIPFGTDRTMNGVDIDPTLPLLAHIVDCFGTLRDVNKIYRAKGSLASRSVGARVLFGFTAELGNLLLDAITFNPPPELKDAAALYISVGNSILSVFPEIAAQITKQSGKMLIHHTALKTSSVMAVESLKMVLKAYPAGAWTVDASGALPLHWLTHNPCCTPELITILINANPKGPWIADNGGYLPLHWAVNQPNANIDVVAALLASNPSAASKPCLRGTLALHWCVSRDQVNLQVLKALLQVYADGARTFDEEGCLPLHRLANRSSIDIEALRLLIDTYPQALQCPNADGELPLHLAVDQPSPDLAAVELILENYPGALQVADDEGYLPLHVALDCANPNVEVAKLLLKRHQQAAYHRTNDGLLPLHCLVSSLQPSVEIIRRLLKIYPTSSEEIAVDLVPVDDNADPETWTGDWKKVRWTPLSRAIERRLDVIVSLFKAATLTLKQDGDNSADATSPNNRKSSTGISAITAKALANSSQPPINSSAVTRVSDEVVVGSVLDESFDNSKQPVTVPSPRSRNRAARGSPKRSVENSPDRNFSNRPSSSGAGKIDDLLAIIHSPRKDEETKEENKDEEKPHRASRNRAASKGLEDSTYSQVDSYLSNGENDTGFDLSGGSAAEDGSRQRRRHHRRHHGDGHHHRRHRKDGESMASDVDSVAETAKDGDEGTERRHGHHHHHRSSSRHRSKDGHSEHRHRSSSRHRSSDEHRDRRASKEKARVQEETNDDIDAESVDLARGNREAKQALQAYRKKSEPPVPSQPKPAFEETAVDELV